MLNVYAWSYGSVGMAMLGSLIIWRILAKCIRQDIWKVMNAVGAVVALLIILRFTVIGRESSNEHCFMVMAEYSGEFYREIIMNIFLYFPLGLTLGELTGCHVIWLAFLLSLGIESWQFAAGTGIAQGTDVLCNTLGACMGGMVLEKDFFQKEKCTAVKGEGYG